MGLFTAVGLALEELDGVAFETQGPAAFLAGSYPSSPLLDTFVEPVE